MQHPLCTSGPSFTPPETVVKHKGLALLSLAQGILVSPSATAQWPVAQPASLNTAPLEWGMLWAASAEGRGASQTQARKGPQRRLQGPSSPQIQGQASPS